MIGACPTWADHEWSAPRFEAARYDPVRGHHSIYTRTCHKCKRTTRETRWDSLQARFDSNLLRAVNAEGDV